MSYTLVRLILASLWLISAYKWGDWRNWKKYYPTILFYSMGDLIYNLVFQDKLLWTFRPDFFTPHLIELFVIFTMFFPNILLFLSNFPKGLFHQAIFMISWIAVVLGIELFAILIGMEKLYNGWSIWWSLLFQIGSYTMVILHYKNPTLAWIITLICLGILMKIFKIPFTISK